MQLNNTSKQIKLCQRPNTILETRNDPSVCEGSLILRRPRSFAAPSLLVTGSVPTQTLFGLVTEGMRDEPKERLRTEAETILDVPRKVLVQFP